MENFFSAFSKLNCNANIKQEYQDVMVEKISASQSKKLVFIYCRKHQLLSYKKIRVMEKELYKQIFKRMGFRPQLMVSYPELKDESLSHIISQIEEDLKEEIREHDLVDGLEFCSEPFEAEGESLYITCGDSFLTRKRCEGVKEFLHTVFLQRFGKDISVEFHFKEFERKRDTKPETYFVTLDNKEKAEPAEGQDGKSKKEKEKKTADKTPQKPVRQRGNFRRTANDPEVFYGKNCEGTVVPVKEIQDEIGEVVIDGQIRSVESREIRGEKLTSLSFSIPRLMPIGPGMK